MYTFTGYCLPCWKQFVDVTPTQINKCRAFIPTVPSVIWK